MKLKLRHDLLDSSPRSGHGNGQKVIHLRGTVFYRICWSCIPRGVRLCHHIVSAGMSYVLHVSILPRPVPVRHILDAPRQAVLSFALQGGWVGG